MSNIIAKIGNRYEVVYYYKQKVINWEFKALSYYECLIDILTSENKKYISKTSLSLNNTHDYIAIAITTYITEDSYKNNSVYYNIEITNITTNSAPLLIIGFENTNTNTHIVKNKVNQPLKTSIPYKINDILITYKDNKLFPILDTIKVEVFTTFPRLTYKHSLKFIDEIYNCVQKINTETIKSIKYNISKSSLSVINYNTIKRIQTSIDTLDNNLINTKINKSGKTLLSGIVLPNKITGTIVSTSLVQDSIINTIYVKEIKSSKTSLSFDNSGIIIT